MARVRAGASLAVSKYRHGLWPYRTCQTSRFTDQSTKSLTRASGVNEKTRRTIFVSGAKLPAVFPFAEWHDAGVLMSYGPSAKEMMPRVASFVDKVLKGARPAELSVEQISQFNPVIDLRVARAMGIRVPDEVIGEPLSLKLPARLQLTLQFV